MAVSVYKNNECKYRIDKLENVVYLINENSVKDIHIDNGEAYIDLTGTSILALDVYNISLTDTDELDERYKFTHTLKFSTNGYWNYKDFGGRYYAIVKSKDDEYWLVNPLFPNKVTYTYTLGANDSHTDFTMATISNHPTLRVNNLERDLPAKECAYRYCGIDRMMLNESKYCLLTGNHIIYTNEGFKEVIYDKDTAVFTEQFDGDKVEHSIKFDIKFDHYKSSWHYNLLEFADNTYCAIIKTTCERYVLTGFNFGLQPSFNVDANGDNKPDCIHIELKGIADNGDFIGYEEEITMEGDNTRYWAYTSEFDGYECIGNNQAKYLLKKELDIFDNPTGNYAVLEGYRERFESFLNIVEEFTEIETFVNHECIERCRLQAAFPNEFIFETVTCREYSLIADSSWSATTDNTGITVTPSNGSPDTSYTVRICNNITPTDNVQKATLTVSYCNKEQVFPIKIRKGDECLPSGSIFDIDAKAQYVVVPTSCCFKSVTESTGAITNIQILSNSIRIYVPQNNTTSARTFTLQAEHCTGDTPSEITINQGASFEQWIFEDTGCTGSQKCEIYRKYTGTTASDISTRTSETEARNCVDSPDCGGMIRRWTQTTSTTCSNGEKYYVMIEESSIDGGSTWTPTGYKDLGEKTTDSPAECEGVTYQYKWELNDRTTCVGKDKYQMYQKYRSIDGTTWEEVIPTTESYNADGDERYRPVLIQADSPDCGYVPPITPQYRWVNLDITKDWVCVGFEKHYKQQRQVSYDNGRTWENLNEYQTGALYQDKSQDCGYIVIDRWVNLDPTTDYYCEGTTKYYKQKRQISEDGGTTWRDTDPIEYRKGESAETESSDCSSEGRWVVSGTTCDTCLETKAEIKIGDETINIMGSGGITYEEVSAYTPTADYIILTNNCIIIEQGAFKNTSASFVRMPTTIMLINDYAFQGAVGIFECQVPEGCLALGAYAFKGCTSLSYIDLPDSLMGIGESCFEDCLNFAYMTIPANLPAIPNRCFYNCKGLVDIEIPSNIRSIGDYAFANCDGLYTVTLESTTPPTLGENAFLNHMTEFEICVPESAVETYKTTAGWSDYADKIKASR